MKDSVATLISGKIKASTKVLIGLLIAFPATMQIEAVKNFVTPLAAAHPKLATAIGALVTIGLVLHSPAIQAIFVQQTTEETAQGTLQQTTVVTPAEDPKK